MKNKFKCLAMLLIFLSACTGLSACGSNDGGDTDLTVLSATMVEARVNDILNLNTDKYIGKTLKAHGPYVKDGDTDRIVIENALACCARGLAVEYDGEFPAVNTKIEIQGIIRQNTEIGVYIDITSLTVI